VQDWTVATRPQNRQKSVRKTKIVAKKSAVKTRAIKKKRVVKDFDFKPKTELGKRLWAIRQRAIASGMKLLNSRQLEKEIQSRRDGVFEDNY
jgi:hypothetical protein